MTEKQQIDNFIGIMKNYAEGLISTEKFLAYVSEDKDLAGYCLNLNFEKRFTFRYLEQYNYDLVKFLFALDQNRCGNQLNIHGIVCKSLVEKGIAFNPTMTINTVLISF